MSPIVFISKNTTQFKHLGIVAVMTFLFSNTCRVVVNAFSTFLRPSIVTTVSLSRTPSFFGVARCIVSHRYMDQQDMGYRVLMRTAATSYTNTPNTISNINTGWLVDRKYDVNNKTKSIVGNYDPSLFESVIYKWWEESGCFQPDAKQSKESSHAAGRLPYVLPMPPPNVTGRLHMGHAIFVALQDVLARFHRMRGRPVLWLPGTDHAGIATQLQVEKALIAEGTSLKEVGHSKFLDRAWAYKEKQGGHITRQLRSLGASADWSRERFTMDTGLCKAVSEAFVRLYEKGLIYRGEYIINWAPLLQTAVSDLEVNYSEEKGKLYFFKYIVENSDDYLPVATTRPETIMGDSAVCVHPADERYRNFIGEKVVVPMSGGRTIPVISDQYVDMKFGTGALKITPGHDPKDYIIGKKFGLPIINIMNKDGSLNENAGKYKNLDRFDARDKLWKDMDEIGITINVKTHMHRVPRSQRGGEIIEHLVSSQWFLRTAGMGAKALNAIEDGDIKIVPQRFNKMWKDWLTNICDWCLSRQLWWGHRIPVWYVGEIGGSEYIVARNEGEAYRKAIDNGHAEGVILHQEKDVLDTWFSSALWPFVTVGWPHDEGVEGSDFERFYPGTCVETGYDILFFWVARMAMMGLELTGKSPFSVVYLHGLVRASDGSKMSKTKGNVIDPLDVVAEYGADSLRYSLVTCVTSGQDIKVNIEKIKANRNFVNKLWNCCKFVTCNALKSADECELAELSSSLPMGKDEFDKMSLPEKYIVSECHCLVASVTKDIENYQLGAAGTKIYAFLWDKYADWYIEISKTRLYKGAGGGSVEEVKTARRVLVYILDTTLRLLHPYMPYVTEQLWQHIPRPIPKLNQTTHALMLADWPQMDDNFPLPTAADTVTSFECFQALTRSIRNARAEYNIEPGKKISAIVIAERCYSDKIRAELKSLVALAKLDPDNVEVYESGSVGAEAVNEVESIVLIVQDGIQVYIPLSGLINHEKEKKRLKRQAEKLNKEIYKLKRRLESKIFVEKAPAEIVKKSKEELVKFKDQASKIKTSLYSLS